MEYTTVKIPKLTYDSARMLQADIARNGTKSLPDKLKDFAQSTVCPLCKTQMNTLQAGYSMHQCPNCGFNKQTFNFSASNQNPDDAVRALAVTGLIVLGLAVLAWLLKE